jgi:hypothetical protein
VGGGLIIVPALVYFAGFSQHRATGTSLAILLLPVGLGAVIEYYRNGNVDIRAAAVAAVAFVLRRLAQRPPRPTHQPRLPQNGFRRFHHDHGRLHDPHHLHPPPQITGTGVRPFFQNSFSLGHWPMAHMLYLICMHLKKESPCEQL